MGQWLGGNLGDSLSLCPPGVPLGPHPEHGCPEEPAAGADQAGSDEPLPACHRMAQGPHRRGPGGHRGPAGHGQPIPLPWAMGLGDTWGHSRPRMALVSHSHLHRCCSACRTWLPSVPSCAAGSRGCVPHACLQPPAPAQRATGVPGCLWARNSPRAPQAAGPGCCGGRGSCCLPSDTSKGVPQQNNTAVDPQHPLVLGLRLGVAQGGRNYRRHNAHGKDKEESGCKTG